MAKIVDNNRDTDHGAMIGKLALNYKKITNDQYVKAIAIQKKESESGQAVTLNEVLLKYDFLSREDIEFLYSAMDILTKKRKEKRLGAIHFKKRLLKKEVLLTAREA